MQMVHLNNVEAMKFMRRSKSPVEVENIKHIEAKETKKGTSPSGTTFGNNYYNIWNLLHNFLIFTIILLLKKHS